MRSYSSVIQKLADKMFNDYMAGGFPKEESFSLVSYIYGVKVETVAMAVNSTYNKMRKEYYAKFHKENS